MYSIMVKQIMQPILRRLGTVLTGFLIGTGVPQETTAQIVMGLTALVLVGVDLALSAYDKRKK